MPRASDGRTSAIAFLILAMVGFGTIPIFLKHFTGLLDAWTVNGVRYSVGAVFWMPFLLLLDRRTKEPRDCPAGRNVWRDAFWPSVINTVGQAGFGLGPYYVSAASMGFVIRLSFLFTVLFGFLLLRQERLLARRTAFWIGAPASMAGVGLMFVDQLQAGGNASVAGLLIMVVSAAAWGGYSVCMRLTMPDYSARQAFGVISIYSSVGLVLLMFLLGDYSALARIDLSMWALLCTSAFIGIALGQVLYLRGMYRVGPVVANGLLLATPFVTYLGSALLLGESMSRLEWAGGVAVVLGGALLVLAQGQSESPHPS